jgi:hypothetical protein
MLAMAQSLEGEGSTLEQQVPFSIIAGCEGIFCAKLNSRMIISVDYCEWLMHAHPRWTPGRGSEVLADSVFSLPGSEARIRLQSYIGTGRRH